MDHQETVTGSESPPRFNSQQDLSPLEHAATSSSVSLMIDGKEMLLGEGGDALSIQDMANTWRPLLGSGVGEINGTREGDVIKKARASKKIFDHYVEIFGPAVLMEMMTGKTLGGLVLSDLTPEQTRLRVYLERDGAFVTEPPELDEKYKNILEYKGTEVVPIDENKNITALTFGVKDSS